MTNKRNIVLDLFIIHAISSSDSDLHLRAGGLIQLIIDKCHKIVLSPSLKREYKDRLKKLNRSLFLNDHLFKQLKKILLNSEKVVEVNDITYDIPVKIPEKDLPIIKTALAKGSGTIIITTDRKHFIENKELQEFLKNNNIKVMLLEDFIRYIREPI